MKTIVTLSLLIAGFGLASCATITRGTSVDFVVKSFPEGAKVKTSNGFYCDATPCTLKMPRKDGFDIIVSKEGFKDWTGKVTSQMSGGGGASLAGNVLAGGIIGMGVDASSGALNDLKPNPLEVKLEPIN